MKDYTNKSPKFSATIRITETTDPGHADNINEAPEQLLQNDLVLLAAFDPELIKNAFKNTFSGFEYEEPVDETAISNADIAKLVNSE